MLQTARRLRRLFILQKQGPRLSATLLLLVLAAGAFAAVAKADAYGVVEIGSRGVRGFAFDLDNANKRECQADEERYTACLNLRSTPAKNVSPSRAEEIKRTIAAVATTATELQQFGVPVRNLYIVGSSGAAKAEGRDLLALEIENTLKPANGIAFVTAEAEAAYGFEGVLNLIPQTYREQRRRQTVLIDIGGGNTKGAFLDLAAGTASVSTFSLPWGTNTATESIQSGLGEKSFAAAAMAWRNEQLVPQLQSVFQSRPGIANRERFYLIGGLPWALATLTQPESTLKFPPIVKAEVERLAKEAADDGASARLCTGNRHRKPGSDVERVCDIFAMKNLVAGAQLLSGLFQELNMAATGKRVFFIRDSQFAWPLGYLRDRLNAQRP